ncbi:crotonobetainyl-CoA:carnitine CoA-transferase CaiB-like acyl-CoA transferase [Streptomyces sp. SAI-124]|uniref:CoA transferase n=1 Tax=Streptomyces sp. SAI-124 TaxID=3377730 RepID=UPI003C7A0444
MESPAGDDTRTFKPPVRDDESTYYLAVNRNKRSVALDLADQGVLVLARRLAHRADVFVHNFKPGTTERYDLGYEQVAAANPGVVYCAISGFGTHGGAALPGYDLLIQAASGMMAMTGEADGPPLRTGISAIDVMTGAARGGRGPWQPSTTGPQPVTGSSRKSTCSPAPSRR